MKNQKRFKSQGIFRVLFNYLYYTNQSHLEKSFIDKLNERPQDEKTLKNILTETGYTEAQANEFIIEIKKINFADWKKKRKHSSLQKAGDTTQQLNPKPLQGGSPGSGKKS